MRSFFLVFGACLAGLALLPSAALAQDWSPAPMSAASVTIRSKPEGAVALLDGRLLCRATPCTRLIEPGKHDLRLVLEGHAPREERIEAKPNLSLTWELTRDGGLLVWEGEQRGLEVRVDGVLVGLTPLPPLPVSRGAHEVVLSSPCHEPRRSTVEVQRGQDVKVRAEAEPMEGRVRVAPVDERGLSVGAEVWVEGVSRGQAPITLPLSVCTRQLELRTSSGRRFVVAVAPQNKVVSVLRVGLRDVTQAGVRVSLKDPRRLLDDAPAHRCFSRPKDMGKGALPIKQGMEGVVEEVQPDCRDNAQGEVLLVRFGDKLALVDSAGVTPVAPDAAPPVSRLRILDAGQVYSTLHDSECLKWPGEELQRLSGARSWGGYYPRNGEEGTLVWTSKHCETGADVYILEIQGRYVPIGAAGVEAVLVAPAPASKGLAVGDEVEVVAPGLVFDEIRKARCLVLPEANMEARVGQDVPAEGAKGSVVAVVPHCATKEPVYVVEIGGKLYPFAAGGVRRR